MNRYVKELIRLSPLLALSLLVLIEPDSRSIVLYATGVVVFFVALSHVTRKLLFPYLDLQKYFDKALEGSVSAALVVASVCMVLSVLIYSGIGLLK